jgi:hypothetical protein
LAKEQSEGVVRSTDAVRALEIAMPILVEVYMIMRNFKTRAVHNFFCCNIIKLRTLNYFQHLK